MKKKKNECTKRFLKGREAQTQICLSAEIGSRSDPHPRRLLRQKLVWQDGMFTSSKDGVALRTTARSADEGLEDGFANSNWFVCKLRRVGADQAVDIWLVKFECRVMNDWSAKVIWWFNGGERQMWLGGFNVMGCVNGGGLGWHHRRKPGLTLSSSVNVGVDWLRHEGELERVWRRA